MLGSLVAQWLVHRNCPWICWCGSGWSCTTQMAGAWRVCGWDQRGSMRSFSCSTVGRRPEWIVVQSWWCIALIWPPSLELGSPEHHNCHARLWYIQTEHSQWCISRSWCHAKPLQLLQKEEPISLLLWLHLHGVPSSDPYWCWPSGIWSSWLSLPQYRWRCSLLPAVSCSPWCAPWCCWRFSATGFSPGTMTTGLSPMLCRQTDMQLMMMVSSANLMNVLAAPRQNVWLCSHG